MVYTELVSVQVLGVTTEPLPVNLKLYRAKGKVSASAHPVLFIPGFGDTSFPPYDSFCEALSGCLRAPVYMLSFPLDNFRVLEAPEGFEEIIPFSQLWKGAVVAGVIERLGFSKINLAGYSEGVPNAIVATLLLSVKELLGMVGDFYFVCPPSLTGPESFLSIVSRGSRKAKVLKKILKSTNSAQAERLFVHNASIKRWLLKSGLIGLPQEVLRSMDPGRIDLLPYLVAFSKKGHEVRLLAGVEDAMIPYQDLVQVAQKNGFLLASYGGSHEEIFLQPEEVAKHVTGR